MATKLASLRAASAPTYFCTSDPNITCTDASAADLKDGSDATVAEIVVFSGANGEHREDWTLDALSLPSYAVIEKVTVRIRGAHTFLFGSADTTIQARIAGVNRGQNHAPSASYAWFTDDFTTDPADGQPWTASKINAQKWGFRLAVSQNVNGDISVTASELEVEVWGRYEWTAETANATGEAVAPHQAVYVNPGEAAAEAVAPHRAVFVGGVEATGQPGTGAAGELAPDTHQPEDTAARVVQTDDGAVPAAVLRPTAPASLGDQSLATLETAIAGGGANPVIGTLSIMTTALEDLAFPQLQISHLVVDAVAMTITSDGQDHVSESRVVYEVGIDKVGSVVAEFGQLAPTDPWSAVYFVLDSVRRRRSANLTTQPNGQPWTEVAVNSLRIGVEVDFEVPANVSIQLGCYELFVEVEGAVGGVGGPVQIRHRAFIGNERTDGKLETVRLRTGVATIRSRLRTPRKQIEVH